jgi:hypothetical protein
MTPPTLDDAPSPDRDRPLQEQISVNRHDIASVQQKFELLNEVVARLGTRVESVENRQTVMDAQVAAIAVTPEAMGLVVEAVLERRAIAARQERQQELQEAFGKTKSVAVYISAICGALLSLTALLTMLWMFVFSRMF